MLCPAVGGAGDHQAAAAETKPRPPSRCSAFGVGHTREPRVRGERRRVKKKMLPPASGQASSNEFSSIKLMRSSL
jgi:hypothetical protein